MKPTNSFTDKLRRWRHTLLPLPRKYGKRFQQVFSFLQSHQHASREEIQE